MEKTTDDDISVSELVDKIERLKDRLLDDMEEFKDKIDDFHVVIQNSPCNGLNRLITAGFVPGAKFVYEGRLNITFVGYTDFLRLEFKGQENRSYYVEMDSTLKRLDLFKKVEDKGDAES